MMRVKPLAWGPSQYFDSAMIGSALAGRLQYWVFEIGNTQTWRWQCAIPVGGVFRADYTGDCASKAEAMEASQAHFATLILGCIE